MRFAFFFILLLLFYFQIHGQQVFHPPVDQNHDHHDCAHSKTVSTRSGTYQQNAMLWLYDVKYYGLDINVDPRFAAISGNVRIVAQVTGDHLKTFVLELMDNMQVDSVVKDSQRLGFHHQNNELLVEMPESISHGNQIDIRVFYQGIPQSSGFFSGFQVASTPYGKPVLWTLSEPLNARQWWPVKQVLEDKADSIMVRITTPEQYMAASNGLLRQIIYPDDSTAIYEWKSYYPIAYYLVSIAVSEYAEYSFFAPLADEQNEVLVQNFIYDAPAYLTAQRLNIERTRDFMQVFSQLFGDYPFAKEKYGHATAPMGGGMEHQTMSTMSGFNYDLVSHELAHQWFGNSVTCASWSDIWINEGFASYGEYLAREMLQGQPSAQSWLNTAHQSVLSAPDGSVYVPPLETSDVWRIFNGRLSYRKGASILHMLRKEVNDDNLFFTILQTYREEFADSVATGDDFRRVAERVTSRSWEYFFDQWYYGEGYPIFEILWWMRNGSLYVRSVQQGSATYPAFFQTSLDFRLTTPGHSVDLRFFQDQPDQTFSAYIGLPVTGFSFDPEAWLLKMASVKGRLNDEGGSVVKVYPNPAGQRFTLYTENPAPGGTYRVYDTKGSLLQEGQITQRSTEIVLNSPTGTNMYLLEVLSGNSGPAVWLKLLRMN